MADDKKVKRMHRGGAPFGGVYFLGMIGSAVYFVQHADGFWVIVLALLKALVWPAFLIHRAFELLNV